MLGLLVAAGWLTQTNALESTSGGTACAFAAAGLSVVAMAAGRRVPAALLSILPILLAGLNLSRLFLHLPVSQWLSERLPEHFLPLFHMSPNDGVQLVVIGAALAGFASSSRFVHVLSELATVSATLLALMTLLGLIFGMPNLCLFVSCLTITWLTGLGFAVLCVSMILAHTEDGAIFSILSAPDAGGVIARRLLPAACLLPIALGWLRVTAQNAGIFDGETGMTVLIVLLVLVTLSIIWWTSWSLSRADSARRQALVLLEASEKRTRMIVQQATDSFVAVDASGAIRDWNAAAEAAFGWTRQEALGKPLDATIAPQDDGSLKLLFESGQTTPASRPCEATARHMSGDTIPVEVSLFPVTVDGELIICAFMRDITERKELQHRLATFYSTVAHELKAPLTSVRGSLSMAVEATEPSLLKRLYENMDASIARLIRLINDLLDVKRIEEGKLELDLEELDVVDLVSAATSELSGMAAEADVELVPVVDAMGKVRADRDRIIQVMANLVSNAIKFSPPEGLVIIKAEPGKTGYLRMSVSDQGPGIPANEIHRLFTRFGQLGQKSTRPTGTGLGLAISRSIIEQHGGTIGVDTETEKGSRFWFELPITSESSKTHTAIEIPVEKPA